MLSIVGLIANKYPLPQDDSKTVASWSLYTACSWIKCQTRLLKFAAQEERCVKERFSKDLRTKVGHHCVKVSGCKITDKLCFLFRF